ncbi:MAG: hypothetical protein ACPGYV_01005 [Phycisphaeraceae bacterium]
MSRSRRSSGRRVSLVLHQKEHRLTRTTLETAHRLIRETDPDVLWRIAQMCDGHGIIDPRKLIETGLDEQAVSYFTETLKSDGTPKGTIFVDGQPVDSLEGVYGLRLLEAIASALDVTYPSFMGRGYQARAIQETLRAHLQIDEAAK